MEGEPQHDSETGDIACTGEEGDTRPLSSTRNSDLPTNSMVTVRLSHASTATPSTTSKEDEESPAAPVADAVLATEHAEDLVPSEESTVTADDEAGESSSTDPMWMRCSSISTASLRDHDSATAVRSRSNSSGTLSSTNSAQVDWDELEKSEEQAPRDEGSDESTAFLLARLEQENNALATNPKAALSRARSRKGTKTRPPSIQQLKRLVNEPTRPSLRYSMVPEPPPMTELDFWAALVNDYPQTVQRLPTLTSNKIRSGIPPPLRGVVWMSIAGSRDPLLEEQYERLCGESSPYENLIGKDIGRSFPGVEMFRDPSGEGQQMLARVLKCFSLYDQKIGYCQGLGFVVGPLLMHMGEKEAFCVLVRLMEHYDLRSCFLPDLSGLHIRIYQFQQLLAKHHPKLSAHLEAVQVEPLYVSQWFLSFFAVTCPLPMLLRIYDVILTEGASETLMRVALSLMRRNEKKIMACTELEDVMGLLLSRALWDTYNCNADDLVNDFVGLTGLVTREGLEAMEGSFKDGNSEDLVAKRSATQNIQAAASRFLGQFWAGSSSTSSAVKLSSPTSSLGVSVPSRPSSFLQRSPSKQSVASTLNSLESADTHLTAATEASAMSRNPSGDRFSVKSGNAGKNGMSSQDRDLHGQIEDLLTALSDMQREQAHLASELQREREEREEDRTAVQRFLERIKKPSALPSLEVIPETPAEESPSKAEGDSTVVDAVMVSDLEDHFVPMTNKRSSLMHQTKQQMREDIKLWKEQHDVELSRSADLSRQISDERAENARILEVLQGTQSKLDETRQDKSRLEQTIADFKHRRYSTESDFESSPATPIDAPLPSTRDPKQYLRTNTEPPRTFSKRSSSLNMSTVLSTENHKPPSEEALLLELVAVKTSEAVARQELDEVKAKLDSLRKILGGGPSPTTTNPPIPISAPAPPKRSGSGGSPGKSGSGHRPSASEACLVRAPTFGFLGRSVSSTNANANSMTSSISSETPMKAEPTPTTPAPTSSSGGLSAGGFFSGWGKRAVSNPAVTVSES